MVPEHITRIAEELELKLAAVQATVNLLKQEATIPFTTRNDKNAAPTAITRKMIHRMILPTFFGVFVFCSLFSILIQCRKLQF